MPDVSGSRGAGHLRLRFASALGCLLVLAGCTSGQDRSAASSPAGSTPTTGTGSQLAGSQLAGDGGSSAAPSSPASKTSAVPTGPVTVGSVTETVASSCPYLDTAAAADAEGNKIGTVSVLTVRGRTMGCRFRFAYADNHYTLEITSARYADATAAYNAMVRLGRSGNQTIGVPGLAPGVDAVLYQTAFYAQDAGRDWACSFAKGATVVTVKTDQTDTSQDAENVAKLIVGRF